ncbi:MAG: hypothetical protein RJB26_2140, partial [Pseudomonadota bacterium]
MVFAATSAAALKATHVPGHQLSPDGAAAVPSAAAVVVNPGSETLLTGELVHNLAPP